jgi:phosphoglycerate dehydrogenase-like enzyme
MGVMEWAALLRKLDRVALNDALPVADWLILACPLTAITRRLIDAGRLALLPDGASLVNVARGEVDFTTKKPRSTSVSTHVRKR